MGEGWLHSMTQTVTLMDCVSDNIQEAAGDEIMAARGQKEKRKRRRHRYLVSICDTFPHP